MNKSLLKKAAIQSVALMLTVVTSSYAFGQYQTVAISASNIIETEVIGESEQIPEGELLQNGIEFLPEEVAISTDKVIMATSLSELKSQVDTQLLEQLSSDYLVIKKPEANDISISLDDLYINKSIMLTLSGAFTEELNSSMVMRVRGDDYFLGDPVYTEAFTQEVDEDDGSVKEIVTKDYGKDISHGITFSRSLVTEAGVRYCDILIELDGVYAYFIYEDTNYYFVDLRKPSEVYDKILVIDPGHGGKDAGAISKGEKYYEKNINLGVVLALKELLDKENIKVYYTRTADDKVFLRPRVTLANAVDCDYFISIHCNSNKNASPNGTEVLYNNTHFKGVDSKDLAGLFSEELGKTVELRNRGTILKHKEDIFIMDKAEVPMILIEIGYLSNFGDLDYLTNQQNQNTVARGIYQGIMKAYEKLPVDKQ